MCVDGFMFVDGGNRGGFFRDQGFRTGSEFMFICGGNGWGWGGMCVHGFMFLSGRNWGGE